MFGLKAQTEPFHLAHYLCLASCIATQQPDAVVLHYVNEPWGPLWDAVKPRITLRVLDEDAVHRSLLPDYPAFAQYRYAHLSDVVRLEILQEHGGVYADMDTLFVARYPDCMFEHACVMGRELLDRKAAGKDAEGSLCNAVILAEPGSTFIQRWMEQIGAAFDGTWSRHSTFLPFELSQQFPADIHVEPESSFFHIPWTAQGIRTLFQARTKLPDTVYSLHLWSHLWWDRNRIDFSSFHEGRITREYVKHARTTYARYARPHLPEEVGFCVEPSWRRQRLEGCLDAGSALVKRLRARLPQRENRKVLRGQQMKAQVSKRLES